ncbi:hypothetical protein OSW16_03560 [Pseudomonas putida]|uniref:hypothetical protein n=1 Tax=Pseudomonas putida TaxID=303 RepID=UPI002271EB37|nr:hypothetical protein [Pseudomonas putida]WAB98752.1 hypothetical protein OSW16_03560 [Pseudomonas putida]
MELFFNDCSLHGQFQDVGSFESSLDVIMAMRGLAKKYGREIYCHRGLMHSRVTDQLNLPQAMSAINRSKAIALVGWFSKAGPFWEDGRRHSPEEYLECSNEVVTDTAIGECAYLSFLSQAAQLASMTPSSWLSPLIEVTWHRNEQPAQVGSLVNHLGAATLELELQKAEKPLQSWAELARVCPAKFENLIFSDNTFSPLSGTPFVSAAAKSIIDLLSVLQRFKATHITGSGRTREGDELYQTYFTGARAWFSDSSDREKRDFEQELKFTDPENPREKISAPYHGKVQTPQMRIHFTWPVAADTPLHVLYIGDKITKY